MTPAMLTIGGARSALIAQSGRMCNRHGLVAGATGTGKTVTLQTLAEGFSPGGPHAQVADILDLTWPVKPVDPAWVVHLPDKDITQWANQTRWEEERWEKCAFR